MRSIFVEKQAQMPFMGSKERKRARTGRKQCTQRKRRIERPRPLDTSLTLRSLFLLSPLRRKVREKTASKETFLTVPIVSPHNIPFPLLVAVHVK